MHLQSPQVMIENINKKKEKKEKEVYIGEIRCPVRGRGGHGGRPLPLTPRDGILSLGVVGMGTGPCEERTLPYYPTL